MSASLSTTALAPECYRLLIRDLELPFAIGILPQEQGVRQRVRISLEADVTEPPEGFAEDIGRVVSYAGLVDGIRSLAQDGQIALVETLAERIAALALADARVQVVRVQVEKPDIIAEVAGVGVLIERRRPISAARAAIGGPTTSFSGSVS